MVESPVGGVITATLVDDNTGQTYRAQVQAQANRPAMLVFQGLPASTRFTLHVDGYQHTRSGFKTFPQYATVHDALCFGAASCNKYRITQQQVTPNEDVWRALAAEVAGGKIDMMLHLGDQIYADDDMGKVEKKKKTLEEITPYSVFAQGLQMLQSTHPSQWDALRPNIIERFRQVYRDTWRHPPTAFVLANVPNLMIYDDHDIRDDLGDKPEHFPGAPGPIRVVLECGRKACVEYQRQLLGPVNVGDEYDAPRLDVENHFLGHWGEYGVMLLDSRGNKTFNPVPGDPRPYLGTSQWQMIYGALAPGGDFERVKTLVVGTQIPLFFFSRSLTERIAKKGDDFEGHWAYGNNQYEMYELLGLLRAWKLRDPSRRIVMVGGDMHLGGYSNVFWGQDFFCQQMLVGPISNMPPKGPSMFGTKAINAFNNQHGEGWSADHFGWFAARNVGLIKTTPQVGRVAVGHLSTSAGTVKLHWATLHKAQVAQPRGRGSEKRGLLRSSSAPSRGRAPVGTVMGNGYAASPTAYQPAYQPAYQAAYQPAYEYPAASYVASPYVGSSFF
jgi:hypothetical protein